MMFGGLMMILFWAGVIVLVILLVRFLADGHRGGSTRDETTALDILKKRYARGEIDKQEFEERKRDLEGG